MSAAEGILVEVREILEKAPDASFGRGYVVQLVAELEATLGVLSSYEVERTVAELNITQLKSELEELKLQYNAEEDRANLLFDARRAAIQDAGNVSYDLLQEMARAEKAEAERKNTDVQFSQVCLDNTLLRTRIITAEAENARLTKMVDWLADVLAEQAKEAAVDFNDYSEEVVKEYWLKEAASRAVSAPTTTEAFSIPCPICGAHGHIGDCEED